MAALWAKAGEHPVMADQPVRAHLGFLEIEMREAELLSPGILPMCSKGVKGSHYNFAFVIKSKCRMDEACRVLK